MTKQEIGNMIQRRRLAQTLTQQDLSEMSGVTSRTIYLIESGGGNFSFDVLQKIAEVLGLEITLDVKKVDK